MMFSPSSWRWDEAKLLLDHGARRIAVKTQDFSVPQLKDIATGGIHPLARRLMRLPRQLQRPFVRSLQRQFDDNGVSDDVEREQLAMHIGKRFRVDLDRAPEFSRATKRDTDRFVGEGAVFGEAVHPAGDVLILGHLIGFPNCCFVRSHTRATPCAVIGDRARARDCISLANTTIDVWGGPRIPAVTARAQVKAFVVSAPAQGCRRHPSRSRAAGSDSHDPRCCPTSRQWRDRGIPSLPNEPVDSEGCRWTGNCGARM